MKKCIFVFLTSFVLMCGTVVRVNADYSDEGVLYYQTPGIHFYRGSQGIWGTIDYTFDENTLFYKFPSTVLDNIDMIAIGYNSSFSNLIYLPEVYDYYLIATIYSKTTVDKFSFAPTTCDFNIINCDNNYVIGLSNVNYYHHDFKDKYTGFTITAKLPELDSTSIAFMQFRDPDGGKIPSTDMYAKFQVMQIEKNNGTDALSSILQKLEDIDLEIDSGFDAISNQISNQHNQLVNGYENNMVSNANDNFNDSADELHGIENQLNSNATTFVNDFTSTGFDSGILATLGASLTFVVTWFTNFWNMGGIWTIGLSTCFAIWIAFYILRTRSK